MMMAEHLSVDSRKDHHGIVGWRRRRRNLSRMIRVLLFLSCLWALQQAAAAAEEEAVIERFRRYLQIPTVHPDPDYQPVTEFLLSQIQSIGLPVRTLEFVEKKPVVLATWRGQDPSLPSLLLNSHTDVVPAEKEKWFHDPFSAFMDEEGNIYARGSQDMKCVGMQYLEAIRKLKKRGFEPLRTIHVSFVPDEEIGGRDGAEKFVNSVEFSQLNVGVVLDEGLASPQEHYRVFNGERSPWWFIIKAVGSPGHGSKLYDNSAIENLEKSLESIMRFRESQFNLVKAGIAAEGEVVSVNPVFLKAGIPTPTGFVMNMQPSEAEAGFDMRVSPMADSDALEKLITEEWAPDKRNMTYEFKQKEPVRNKLGHPLVTTADTSNPWWLLLQQAVIQAGGQLGRPEIFPAATDCRYVREHGIPAFGFSPMFNTPILLHDHNEFLNKGVYLKGIKMYEAIIDSFATSAKSEEVIDQDSHAEL